MGGYPSCVRSDPFLLIREKLKDYLHFFEGMHTGYDLLYVVFPYSIREDFTQFGFERTLVS